MAFLRSLYWTLNIETRSLILLSVLVIKRGHEIWCPPSLEDFVRMNFQQMSRHRFSIVSLQSIVPWMFLCSVGGDGTILSTLPLVNDSDIPVFPINTGSFGVFWREFLRINWRMPFRSSRRGITPLEARSRYLHLESSEKIFEFEYALNDFVIHKKETSSMIVVHAYLNGEFLNSYWSEWFDYFYSNRINRLFFELWRSNNLP